MLRGVGRVRDLGDGFGSCAEPQNASAEGDSADCEPGPAQGKTGDDIGEPVDVEQDAAGGDRNCDSRRKPGQDSTGRPWSPASKQERGSRIEGRGRRGVPAGERRSEGSGGGVESGPHPGSEVFHGVA